MRLHSVFMSDFLHIDWKECKENLSVETCLARNVYVNSDKLFKFIWPIVHPSVTDFKSLWLIETGWKSFVILW